jgi:hypothetical protein
VRIKTSRGPGFDIEISSMLSGAPTSLNIAAFMLSPCLLGDFGQILTNHYALFEGQGKDEYSLPAPQRKGML